MSDEKRQVDHLCLRKIRQTSFVNALLQVKA